MDIGHKMLFFINPILAGFGSLVCVRLCGLNADWMVTRHFLIKDADVLKASHGLIFCIGKPGGIIFYPVPVISIIFFI